MKKTVFAALTAAAAALPALACAFSASAETGSEIMDALSAVHDSDIYEVLRTDPIRPAEEIDGMYYVAAVHMQELNGLLVRCDDPDVISGAEIGGMTLTLTDYTAEKPAGGTLRIAQLSDYFSNYYDLRERVRGEYAEKDDALLQSYIADGVWILTMDFGSDNADAEQAVIDWLTECPDTEIAGILTTQWTIKGYYDDMSTQLDIVLNDGYEFPAEALNTDAYLHLRDLHGQYYITDDGQDFETVAALCDLLEAREEIASAWIQPVYLAEFAEANEGSHSFSVKEFTAEADVTDEPAETTAAYEEPAETETTAVTVTGDSGEPETTAAPEPDAATTAAVNVPAEATETTTAEPVPIAEPETTAASAGTLPQTGNNAPAGLLFAAAALLMTGTGIGAVTRARRK